MLLVLYLVTLNPVMIDGHKAVVKVCHYAPADPDKFPKTWGFVYNPNHKCPDFMGV